MSCNSWRRIFADFAALGGLSQVALAHASGLSRRTIVNLEKGNVNVGLVSLDVLADALDVGFIDLVAPPSAEPERIGVRAWRGTDPNSEAVLLGSAPASHSAQLWRWSRGPEEKYRASPDPAGWHEMVFVVTGRLGLSFSNSVLQIVAGDYAVYSSAQPYEYLNLSDSRTTFVRVVVA